MKWLLIACLTLGGCCSQVKIKAGSTVSLISADDSRAIVNARDELNVWRFRINVIIQAHSIVNFRFVVITVPSHLAVTLINDLKNAKYKVVRIDNNTSYTSPVDRLYIEW